MSLNKETIKRIASDVKNLLNNKTILENENIYYKHSENNLLNGYALIIGNEDTPYKYGYYFFKFDFPDNYPFSPPKVTFLTNDGKMRFNPNYYTCGKVCLSLLNTWKGDGWTSCQTIYSILIVLANVLSNNPLLNEPGINITNPNLGNYNFLVEYKNYEFAIIKQLELLEKYKKETIENNNNNNNNELIKKNEHYNIILNFEDVMKITFNKNKEHIKNNINNLQNNLQNNLENNLKNININKETNIIYINVYNLSEKINFKNIKNNFNAIFNNSFYKIE